ncbi:Diacylglycerol acyltransferase, putative [Acanthamoeba castellanii str. Neff]|uniref:Acyltransferase n=1 Tax=Acanthamoeba castellanii (strain ATCC 30010 / Neff) TaxID=1257118 RepID=L8HBX2_ACACF|nr:Diacylglycerol acyltransferase, putative [Acanthamoeba castellanii str. Neff]ELR21901.1 Diacylglycerol acyltransferase, putative [Acanthamoeba castellanii str. Neff]
MVWMMREGDGVVMPKLKRVKRGLRDHLSGGTAAMREALWTAAVYVSLSVWHYLFFHQFLLFALLFAAFELAPTYAHVLAFLTVGYLYFYFDGSERTGKRRWEWFLTSWITDALTDYFPMKLIRTKELPPGQYIFGVHPHGVMPFSAFPIGKTSQWPKLFPGIRVQSLTASCLFKMPITRELALWAGGIDASRANAERALENKFSLLILPGGSLEILEAHPHLSEQVLVLERRKGFIELALKYGIPLVPVYSFGATELYDQLNLAKSWREWMIHRLRFAPTIAWGTSPWKLLPAKCPVYVVVGEPVTVDHEPMAQPTKEAIDALHARYKQALLALFEKHKHAYGYGNSRLVIT